MSGKFRLITRSDFDGLMCGALLKELDMIDEIEFVHPKDMQDGKIVVTNRDITTNLPYVEGVHLSFDHHASELTRLTNVPGNLINDPEMPSAARVIYRYFGGRVRFPTVSDQLMEAVDKTDSAQFSLQDILNPQDWVLMGFLMDNRTGLGRFRDFRISNRQLMLKLIDQMISMDVGSILKDPDVNERVELYREQEKKFLKQVKDCTKIYKNFAVLDLRDQETIYSGNRFVIYALFPECNISAHIMWGFKKQNTVIAVGKSVIDRSSKTNIGELMLKYGGGGHVAAGTCQIDNDKLDEVLPALIAQINTDG